jgi:RNA methyltransferase, TrmH family
MPINKSQAKYIQSLGHKKFRDQEGVFVTEGPKTVGELLRASNMKLVMIYAVKAWDFLTDGKAPAAGLLTEISETELERISSLATPNQVLAIFEKPIFPPPVFNNSLCLVLDGVQDPGNLGTIVRIADWFGIPQVYCSHDSADVFNAKAIQATMGSISRVHVMYGDPEELILENSALPVFAAVLEGDRLYDLPRIKEGLILIGNESKGIRPDLLRSATQRVTIPRIGQAESLNAAVATGIILSHLVSL